MASIQVLDIVAHFADGTNIHHTVYTPTFNETYVTSGTGVPSATELLEYMVIDLYKEVYTLHANLAELENKLNAQRG